MGYKQEDCVHFFSHNTIKNEVKNTKSTRPKRFHPTQVMRGKDLSRDGKRCAL